MRALLFLGSHNPPNRTTLYGRQNRREGSLAQSGFCCRTAGHIGGLEHYLEDNWCLRAQLVLLRMGEGAL